MVAAVVAAYLYIKLIVSMYLVDPDEDAEAVSVPRPVAVVIGVAALITVGFGIFPGVIDEVAQDALAQLTFGS